MPLLTRPLHRLGGGAKTPVRSLTVTSAPCLATCLATSRRGEQDTESVSCYVLPTLLPTLLPTPVGSKSAALTCAFVSLPMLPTPGMVSVSYKHLTLPT